MKKRFFIYFFIYFFVYFFKLIYIKKKMTTHLLLLTSFIDFILYFYVSPPSTSCSKMSKEAGRPRKNKVL